MLGMKGILRFLFLFFISISTFGQQYFEGEIFVKLKTQYGTKIKNVTKSSELKQQLPFLESRILSNGKIIEKISKAFPEVKNNELKNILRLKLTQNDDLDKIIEQMKADGYYQYVEKVPFRKIIAVPNDTDYANQWSIQKIKAAEAWDVNPGGVDVIVAVVDNAVQTNHVDLAANMLSGKDMSSETDFDPNPPNATFSHGTHVAGIVSAVTNNNVGIAGSANNRIKILPVKATPDGGNPNGIYYGFEGIQWAVDHGAKIISLSWGGPGYSSTEQEVIDYAYQNGVMIVAAAGNENSAELQYPASYNHVISVASLDATDVRSSFSSYGQTVDISAPGRSILSTLPFDTYGSYSGTSMATPLVSSCLGFLWSCFPALTLEELENLIKTTSDKIDHLNPSFTGQLGAGRINLLSAVACKTENLVDFSVGITPSRYFCVGDTVNLSVPNVPGGSYEWFNATGNLIGSSNSLVSSSEGVFTAKVSKGFCIKSIDSKPLVYNKIISNSPGKLYLESQFCSGKDTLNIDPPNCNFPDFYQGNYAGPVVGYDGFEKSGNDPEIALEGVAGLIDSVEVSITWHKKDGGGNLSCGNADGGGIPFNEEIGFELVSPSGQKYTLISAGTYARGTVSAGLVTTTFKNNKPVVVSNSYPVTGVFGPVSSFSTLVGEIPNGTWKLLPVDNSLLDPLCVSGFSIKLYTNAAQSASQLTWWDNQTNGNIIGNNGQLILENLNAGVHDFYSQNQCTGLCPSERVKNEIWVKSKPEVLAFKFTDVILTEPQVMEIVSASQIHFSNNSQNIYFVNGINAYNNPFSYQISNKTPLQSPVTICGPSNFVVIAAGCEGQIQWSDGTTNAGVLIQNLNADYQLSANCVENFSCPPQGPQFFSFINQNSEANYSGNILINTTQDFHGNKISSDHVIHPSSRINYSANQNIILEPGFSVEKGNVFKASIEGCSN